MDPELAPLFEGFSEADSIAVDPHKWLAVPVGCGATFVRDRELLRRAFTLEPAEYLEGSVRQVETINSQFDGLGYTFHDFNVEQSAQSRGVTMMLPALKLSLNGFELRDHSLLRRDAARDIHVQHAASVLGGSEPPNDIQRIAHEIRKMLTAVTDTPTSPALRSLDPPFEALKFSRRSARWNSTIQFGFLFRFPLPLCDLFP